MYNIKILQNEQSEFLIELDLDHLFISAGTLIDKLSRVNDIHILEWNQYTEYATGKLSIYGGVVNILWEDFPNIIDFYSKYEDALKVLEYELKKVIDDRL